MQKLTYDVTQNYTVYLMSFGNIEVDNSSQITGGRVGMCGLNITIKDKARVNTDGLGCKTLHGPGSISKVITSG